MAENVEKKEGKKEEGASKSGGAPSAQAKREAKKSRWTIALCKKYAKRFHSAEAWAEGAPASFKAAKSKGWLKECVALMKPAASKPKKTSSSAKPSKKGRAA